MAKISDHEFRTRFLNHLISFLNSSEAATERHSFKLHMDGQLGRYGKKKYKEAEAAEPLKRIDLDGDLEKEFNEAIKFSLIILKTQDQEEVINKLIDKIKDKEQSIKGFNPSNNIETLLDSFKKLKLSSNIEDVSYSVRAKDTEENWSRILNTTEETEIELPSSTYKIRCMKSQKYVQEKVELNEKTNIHFTFEEGLNKEEKEETLLEKINPFS